MQSFEEWKAAKLASDPALSRSAETFLRLLYERQAVALEELEAEAEGVGPVEYKVLTQKDRFLVGRFSPERLEQAINAYASDGWRVVGVTTVAFPGGLAGTREEMIIIMERQVRGP